MLMDVQYEIQKSQKNNESKSINILGWHLWGNTLAVSTAAMFQVFVLSDFEVYSHLEPMK